MFKIKKGKAPEWITADGLEKVRKFAQKGLSDAEIAKQMGICVTTFYDWQHRYPEFADALVEGKIVPDDEVEAAFFSRCIGIRTTVKRLVKVKHIEYDPDTGAKMYEKEDYEQREEEIYIPPDVNAQMFYLRNRRPGRWAKDPEQRGVIAATETKLKAEADKINDNW